MKLTTILMTLLLTAGLMTSCGSSKKKNNGEAEAYAEDNKIARSLEINGDSDSGRAGDMKTVYFAYNSSNLTSFAKATLDNNAKFLVANASVQIQIEGHCDERGGVEYNLALGEKRARTVKQYLGAMGVDASRVTIVSFGKERPIEFGHTETAWSKNRRANFVITAK